MQRFVLLAICFLLSFCLNAQNLISNPSFSEHNDLNNYLYSNHAIGWSDARGTPDCPVSEEKAVGIILYKHKWNELISSELIQKLKKDVTYCISLDVKYQSRSSYSTSDFGIMLTKKPYNPKNDFHPQLSNDSSNILNDTLWKRLEWQYTATGNEKYITIGNFKTPSSTNVRTTTGEEAIDIHKPNPLFEFLMAYYLIDNIYLFECDNPPAIIISNVRNNTPEDSIQTVDKIIIKENTPVVFEINEKYILDDVLFDFNKSTLNEFATSYLVSVVDFLKMDSKLKIELIGYTDNIGTIGYNTKLSEQRAHSVANFLLNEGIENERIESFGVGSSNPRADNKTDEGRKKNRRVEFQFIKKDN